MDRGNSRLKWQLLGADMCPVSGGIADDVDDIGSVFRAVAGAPHRVVVVSVAGGAADSRLAGQIHSVFGVSAEFLVSVAECAGLHNGYRDPGRLGVDRWMAVLGAWSEIRRSCLVVDAGTAMTIDAVADNRHLGGYILPGLRMQRESLGQRTALVGSSLDAGTVDWGRATQEAVANGTLLSAVATIERALVELQRAVDDTCPLFVTGGDAPVIAPLLSVPAVACDDLVFRGMIVQGLQDQIR